MKFSLKQQSILAGNRFVSIPRGEGASFAVLQGSVTMAQEGQKVLVICRSETQIALFNRMFMRYAGDMMTEDDSVDIKVFPHAVTFLFDKNGGRIYFLLLGDVEVGSKYDFVYVDNCPENKFGLADFCQLHACEGFCIIYNEVVDDRI